LSSKEREWLNLLSGESDGEIALPVLSGSMADALLPGDMLTVRPLAGAKARVGDIVVFRDGGKLVAHRLIFAFRLFGFALLAEKGDANRQVSILRPKAIVGRVEAARREGILVLEMTAATKKQGRRLAVRSLLWHLLLEFPKDVIKTIAGRHA
jgi:hypothetical protein